MENLISRHRNVCILVAVLFAQVLGLAVQVKRTGQSEGTRLIRIWTVGTITPFEKALVWSEQSVSNGWHNYLYLRGVRAENRELRQRIGQMHLEEVRLSEDAEQARRLQLLLGFKEKFIAKTVAAQIIGSSGSEQSRSVYIDKGSADGVKSDQAVITAEGIVGKVIDVYQEHTAKVLLVNDQTSGVGVVLEKSRLQGILRGTPSGELVVEKILSDESVEAGERVLTSGGDQIFPKGLAVGVVNRAAAGSDSFLNIRLKPAVNLSKLEEVLVVTAVETRSPSLAEAGGRVRAADILAERLPSVPRKPAADPNKPSSASGVGHDDKVAAGDRTENLSAARKTLAPEASAPSRSGSRPNPSLSTAPRATGAKGLEAITGSERNQTGGVPANSMSVAKAAKPYEMVPPSSANAQPLLVAKPANQADGAVVKPEKAKPASKSAPAAKPKPTAPVEDNPQ
ncbi:MAG: rod shape-determining protein MreC [Acidobacteria bacterium]|nr:rod shape-determining protein MreC [Acidobacteriota bacterium]